MEVNPKLQRAKSLIEARRYEEARALLITMDHPTADKWLERINLILSQRAAQRPAYQSPPQSFTGKLFLSIFLLLFLILPGVIALAIFGKEARDAQSRSNVPLPGARELMILNRVVFILLIVGLAIFLIPLLINLVT